MSVLWGKTCTDGGDRPRKATTVRMANGNRVPGRQIAGHRPAAPPSPEGIGRTESNIRETMT